MREPAVRALLCDRLLLLLSQYTFSHSTDRQARPRTPRHLPFHKKKGRARRLATDAAAFHEWWRPYAAAGLAQAKKASRRRARDGQLIAAAKSAVKPLSRAARFQAKEVTEATCAAAAATAGELRCQAKVQHSLRLADELAAAATAMHLPPKPAQPQLDLMLREVMEETLESKAVIEKVLTEPPATAHG